MQTGRDKPVLIYFSASVASYHLTFSLIEKIDNSGCLELVISLIYSTKEKSGLKRTISTTISNVITKPKRENSLDIENAIKGAAKARRKNDKDPARISHQDAIEEELKSLLQAVTPDKAVEEVIARTDAADSQRETDGLRMHAFLAVAAFVRHRRFHKIGLPANKLIYLSRLSANLRSIILKREVLKGLVQLFGENSENVSTVAAQALLHMLVFGETLYVMHQPLHRNANG